LSNPQTRNSHLRLSGFFFGGISITSAQQFRWPKQENPMEIEIEKRVKLKIAELSGNALHWAVAIYEGYKYAPLKNQPLHNEVQTVFHWFRMPLELRKVNQPNAVPLEKLCYSTDPVLAWPIINRKTMDLVWMSDGNSRASFYNFDGQYYEAFGESHLVSAMRAFVLSEHFDASIEVPESLIALEAA